MIHFPYDLPENNAVSYSAAGKKANNKHMKCPSKGLFAECGPLIQGERQDKRLIECFRWGMKIKSEVLGPIEIMAVL